MGPISFCLSRQLGSFRVISFLVAIKSSVKFNNTSLLVDIEDVGRLARLSHITELLTVAALFTAIAAAVFLAVVSALLGFFGLLGLFGLLGSRFSLCLEDFSGLLHALHDIGEGLLNAVLISASGTFVIVSRLLAFSLVLMHLSQLLGGLLHS